MRRLSFRGRRMCLWRRWGLLLLLWRRGRGLGALKCGHVRILSQVVFSMVRQLLREVSLVFLRSIVVCYWRMSLGEQSRAIVDSGMAARRAIEGRERSMMVCIKTLLSTHNLERRSALSGMIRQFEIFTSEGSPGRRARDWYHHARGEKVFPRSQIDTARTYARY